MGVKFDTNEIMEDLGESLLKEVHDIANLALAGLVIGTPVGNPLLWQSYPSYPKGYVGGHARRNWRVAVGRPPTGELPGVDASGAGALSAGRAVVERWDDFSRILWIANNVPYIVRLNNGHSTQAPVGWVEVVVEKARTAARAVSVEI